MIAVLPDTYITRWTRAEITRGSWFSLMANVPAATVLMALKRMTLGSCGATQMTVVWMLVVLYTVSTVLCTVVVVDCGTMQLSRHHRCDVLIEEIGHHCYFKASWMHGFASVSTRCLIREDESNPFILFLHNTLTKVCLVLVQSQDAL